MKLLFVFVFVLLAFQATTQDNIIQADGTEIKAKVLEVGLDNIKYKRFDNIDGPTYTVPKAQVFMIQYENGTRDVFDKTLFTSSDSVNQMNILADSLSVKSHIFLNGGVRIGVLPSQMNTYNSNIYYTDIGLTVGFDIELGNVFYFAPKKMPKNFGVGLNFTWFNIGFIIGHPSTIFSPYTVSAGPQFSYRVAKKMFVDFYFKPGMSLVHINNNYAAAFLMDVGINFRYKSFMVGLKGAIVPTIYDNYYNTYTKTLSYNVSYNFSHIRIGIGVAFLQK